MKFRKRYRNKSLHTIIAIIFCISMLLLGQSIAYSAFNSTMKITGDAYARVEEDTRITGISLDSVTYDGLELYSPEYSKNTIKTGVRLDNLNSTVNYKVNITNSGSIDMTVNNIIAQVNNNPNIIFEYDYELESKISTGVTTINFTFRYSDSITSLPTDTVCEVVLFFEIDKYRIPMLAPSKTWYKSTTYERSKIKSIQFIDEYSVGDGVTVLDSWDASVGQDEAVMAYILADFTLIIAGRGEGVIYANPDSSYAFSDYQDSESDEEYTFYSVTSMTGTDIFDTSTATDMEYMFYQFM